MHVIDISLPLAAEIPPWPGDVPFEKHTAYRRDTGAPANVSRFGASAHYGTHADAPFHFEDDGVGIDQIDLARYCGPAQVADVAGHPALTAEVLRPLNLRAAPRLLLRTGCRRRLEEFPAGYPPLTVEAVAVMAEAEVGLVGLDAPSVDRMGSSDLPVHHALGRADILILENLQLDGVAPGLYNLFAVPLKIVGCDGAPVRAILVER